MNATQDSTAEKAVACKIQLPSGTFRGTKFNADPATMREVTHRGNCESAIRDGVSVINVIHQRLQGNYDAVVMLEEVEEEAVAEEKLPIAAIAAKQVEASGPPPAAMEPSGASPPHKTNERLAMHQPAYFVFRSVPTVSFSIGSGSIVTPASGRLLSSNSAR